MSIITVSPSMCVAASDAAAKLGVTLPASQADEIIKAALSVAQPDAQEDERGVSKMCMDLLKEMHEAKTMAAGYDLLADFTAQAGLGVPVPLREAQPSSTDGDGIGYFSVPMGLHPETAKLVADFAFALASKLHRAERKYGYTDGWRRDDWRDELVGKLMEHVHKGDQRDVAAYCAFAWHHQWSIAPAQPAQDSLTETAKRMAYTWSDTKWPGNMIASQDEFWNSLEEGHRTAWLAAARAAAAQENSTAVGQGDRSSTPVRCSQCGWLGDVTELGAEGECGGEGCPGTAVSEITTPADMIDAWQDSEGQICGPQLAEAGLIAPHPATDEEAKHLDMKPGDSVWKLTDQGKAVLAAARGEG